MASRKGMTTGETLVAIVVIVLFAAIVIPIYVRSQRRDLTAEDAAAMRRIYVGIAMYQDDNHGAMPPSLAVLGDTIDQADLLSASDPYRDTAQAYPLEPTLPELPTKVPYRISHAYLGDYLRSGRAPVKRWQDVPPLTGLLANVWQGDIQKTTNFGAVTHGPVLRVRMDGSLFKLAKRKHPDRLGDYDDLFRALK